jgi:predicted phosphodiesterase
MLLGDTHRNLEVLAEAFKAARAAECEEIIQLGDFGFGWSWLAIDDRLSVCRFSAAASILSEKTSVRCSFIDGNHENFDRLFELGLDERGRRQVAPGVYHLPRGHRFELDGCSFLACGGATSLDRAARQEGVSWWAAEALSAEDVAACGSEPVDVLLAHDMPVQCGIRRDRHQTGFGIPADMDWYRNRLRLGEVLEATRPAHVFHGHLHHRYDRHLPELACEVHGLGSDAGPIEQAAVIFDTSTAMLEAVRAA